ncbi:MAG: hypothetical protein A2V88_02690 [Elusimicrobia bacterium RBG_16_66_12]|nr:MAG: hypothetical protein A2V88_02690 [Elusimicrobia bacterium RBG_16_66_12]
MRWKIYYDDRTTFSSEDGRWSDAPTDGVLFVVVWDERGKTPYSGADYYYMEGDQLCSTHDLGPLLRKLGIVKFGRWTSIRRMEEAAARVREDG